MIGSELEDGAIASVTPERIRIRTLPISQPWLSTAET
jgi:hypothetical protein